MVDVVRSSQCHIFLEQHNDSAKEWGALSVWALNPTDISYEPKINSRILQGERDGAGAQVDMGE